MERQLTISRRSFVAGATAMCGAASMPLASALASGRAPVMVELFTSQGCSSCPPADRFMGELVKRPGIIAVSMNVDYWDYLGWRDTLGSPLFSRRQRDYAVRRGDGRVYTPQMIINGRVHEVGSDRKGVLEAIEAQAAIPDRYYVPIELAGSGVELKINVGAGPTDRIIQGSTVWLMSVQPEATVAIRRGENSGREITYHNVVRQITPVGMWKGEAQSFTLPKGQFVDKQNRICVAVLQVDGAGPILGCTKMEATA